MRVFLALLLLISPGLLPADGPDPSLPAGDQRAIRELQAKEYGAPTLADDAPAGEGLLAIAALGSSATQPGEQNLQGDDYAALLALLQRYRDDLLKMGMDSSELQAQLSILEARTKELEARLDALQPRDGLKIFGRFYTLFDDLQVDGPGYIPSTPYSPLTPGSVGKPLNVSGVRTQLGISHTELRLEGTRGPVTGYAQLDLMLPWGDNVGNVGVRKTRVEMRLPIAVEAGDLDADLSPLTLWRNESYQPFQPSIFSERYQRMEDDLLLVPDEWPLTGVRLSTDALICNSVTVHLQTLSAIVGAAAGSALANYSQQYVYVESPSEGALGLEERYNTYLQTWLVSVPMLENRLNLGYEGSMFFDVASTAPPVPGSPGYVPMNETVQSLSVAYKGDSLIVNAEAAASSYTAPWLNNSVQSAQGPLTGTAFTADGKWQGGAGYVKVFGRMVSSGFHASGAQGRTVDYAYQFLGPFLTENSQVSSNGQQGILQGEYVPLGGGSIPLSNASRLNDVLIPPGVYTTASGSNPGTLWQNLMAYGPGEEIDPYGVATPNRAGGGLEAAGLWFNGALAPLISAEDFNELDPVTDAAGGTLAAFSMTRYRGGLTLDLEPMINWPLRLGGGYTMTDSQDGKVSNGITNAMTTQTMDASVQWNAGKPMGIQAGYRQMAAAGQDETFVFESGGMTWDIMGVGVWWRPTPAISVDLVSTLGHTVVAAGGKGVPSEVSAGMPSSGNLTWAENLIRATLEF
jgi:hypothetical protein